MSVVSWAKQTVDPKRKYRFRMYFGTGALKYYYVKTAMLPKANVSVVEHSYFDYNFKFPGRVTWDPITVTMVAPADPTEDPTNELYKILLRAGYRFPNLATGEQLSLSKTGFQNANFSNIRLQTVGNDGTQLDEWTLNNAFLTNIDFGGSLEYASDDLIEVSFEINFDWATKTDSNSATPGGTGPAF